MWDQVSHRRHPLHPSSIRDVRSVLCIRFLKSLNDLHVLSFLSSLLHKMGPKYRRECLPNETVFSIGSLDLLLSKLIYCKWTYSMPHRCNLTLVRNICEAASWVLFWTSKGLNESPEVFFEFLWSWLKNRQWFFYIWLFGAYSNPGPSCSMAD